MKQQSKGETEKKLIDKVPLIQRKYLTIDSKLLKAIALDDDDSINELLIKNSSDRFLDGIINGDYELFRSTLIDSIIQNHKAIIDSIKQPKDLKKTITTTTSTTTIIYPGKKKQKPTLQKPGKYKSKKGKRQKWSKAENNRVKILLKAKKKPRDIIKDLNTKRLTDKQTLRTNSSVYGKIKRVRKEIKKGLRKGNC